MSSTSNYHIVSVGNRYRSTTGNVFRVVANPRPGLVSVVRENGEWDDGHVYQWRSEVFQGAGLRLLPADHHA